MARSIKKGPFFDNYLLKKAEESKDNKKPVKTWSRRSTIIPDFVGSSFLIHNLLLPFLQKKEKHQL